MQVHEEVLRLLLAAVPHLNSEELSTYLSMTLDYSKKSRRRNSKRAAAGGGFGAIGGSSLAAAFPSLSLSLGFGSEIGSDVGGSDIGSDGWAGMAALKLSASDNVRSVYLQFTRLAAVTRDSVPALFAYLEEGESKAAAGEGGGGGGATVAATAADDPGADGGDGAAAARLASAVGEQG